MSTKPPQFLQRLTSLRLVQHQILPAQHTRLVPQLGGQLFPRREGIFDPLFTLPDGVFLLLLGFLVDVFAAFTGLTAELWEIRRDSARVTCGMAGGRTILNRDGR